MSSGAERRGLLLAAAYLAAALHGLGASDIVGDDEAREVGIVQDVAAGHVLLPRFNAELLPDKPILYHWLAAIPCAVTGFSETAVRLPAALAGAALVAWAARFGTALAGAPAGVVAAGLLATNPAFFAWSRVARPDVLLVLLLAIALGLAFHAWRDGERRAATGALLALGAATFAKGPVAPALFATTLAGFLLWQRDLRGARRLVTVPGLAAFAVLGLGWYAVALAGWGDIFVREHLVGRYLWNLAGGLPAGGAYSNRPLRFHLLFYAEHLPIVALPWTPFVALGLWRAGRAGGFRDPRLRFLVCWALAPVVVFTPAQYKLRHYLLPALPALALLGAPAVVALCREPARWLPRRGLVLLAGATALALLAVAWLVTAGPRVLSRSDEETLAALLAGVPGGAPGVAAIVGLALGLALVALAWRAWPGLVGLVAAGSVAWMVLGAPALERSTSRRDSLKAFARAVAARYPPPAPLAFFGETIRPVAVYVGRSVPAVQGARRLSAMHPLIVAEATYGALAARGRVGAPLLTAEGRVANLGRTRVVLTETVPGARPAAANIGTPLTLTRYPTARGWCEAGTPTTPNRPGPQSHPRSGRIPCSRDRLPDVLRPDRPAG